MEVEFGSELRERFSSNRKVPLIGLSSKGLLAWSSARILKRRLKIRGNSFGICDLSNKDTLACRPPLTLPCSKSPSGEQMEPLNEGRFHYCEPQGRQMAGHYLKGEPLWTLVYSCFKCNIRYLSQPIQDRACVNHIHSCNNARLYTAYSAYHSLRKLHSDLLHNAISSGNFESVYDELLTLIHLFKADTNRGPFD